MKIKLEIELKDLAYVLEMLDEYLMIHEESIDNIDEEEEVENLKSLHEEYERVTAKLIEVHNEHFDELCAELEKDLV